ncbi:MAG TPA: amidohydrolase family protein, partial [Vicingus sp.]|nr:amidohydrolase family protein [Vicingus sp.]
GVIDAISSDHTPQDIEMKQCEFDHAKFGMINLQTSFASMNTALNGKVELQQMIDLITVNPRKILNLDLPKIKEGEMANLTLFSPTTSTTLKADELVSKSKNTPLVDRILIGKVYGIVNQNKFEISL